MVPRRNLIVAAIVDSGAQAREEALEAKRRGAMAADVAMAAVLKYVDMLVCFV